MRLWPRSRRGKAVALGGCALAACGLGLLKQRWVSQFPAHPIELCAWLGRSLTTNPLDPLLPPNAPAELATWPLPGAKQDSPHRGVTHWFAKDSHGTTVDVLDFDFTANPHLRWGLFDQDEDDDHPFDNHTVYGPRSSARFTKEFNAGRIRGRAPGKIIAAWNGAFFGYYDKLMNHAFHVSPVVLNGQVHFNTANHRWTFGVKYDAAGHPTWKTFHLPSKQTLAREYDWAAGGVQCLIKDGQPLKTEPFPQRQSQVREQPVPSTPQEAGHIPYFDHMRTCRASLAWSRDNRHLYLLLVKEPDFEGGSSMAFTHGFPDFGGWTVPDVQRFWLKKGVWGAINSDAGNVAQLVFAEPNGGYTMVPSRQTTGLMRVNCPPDWRDTPTGGGAQMYFYVWEA